MPELKAALEIVIQLAEQNVLDDDEDMAERLEQETAIELVRAFLSTL